MAHLLNENTPLDLDWLTHRYAGVTKDKRIHKSGGVLYFSCDYGTRHRLDEFPEGSWTPKAVQELEAYCRNDVVSLRSLYDELKQRLQESEWWDYFEEESVPYTSVLVDMECAGMPVDLDMTAVLATEVHEEKVRLGQELMDEAKLPGSFNLNSGDQLATYLFSRSFRLRDRLPMDLDPLPPDRDFEVTKVGRLYIEGEWILKGRGLAATPPPKDKVTGKEGKRPSTSTPELLYMHAGDEWVRKLCLEYRKREKLLTTYLEKFPRIVHKGRVYGRYNQAGTVTGRLSSSEPNMQNMPARGELGKKTRALFRGNLVIGDYDQLEMRLMAHFSLDPRLVKVFQLGRDPHLITAQAIFGENVDPDGEERGIGKTLNFAIGYGAGPRKVAQVLSLSGYPTTRDVAEGYLAELHGFYRGYYRWKDQVIAKAKRSGNVRTIGGRRRRLRGAFQDVANWRAMGYGERQAVNAVIQGSAADILQRVMVTGRWQDEMLLLAQVHDELVWEWVADYLPSDEQLAYVGKVAQTAHNFVLSVPLVFEPHHVHSWAEKDGPEIEWEDDDDEV